MDKDKIIAGVTRVKFPNGQTGLVIKIGFLLCRVQLDNGDKVWASSKEFEKE